MTENETLNATNGAASPEAAAMPQPAEEAPHVQTPAVDETGPSLEELLRQAEQKAQERHDAWLRAMAEVENTRRRAAEEAERARKFALEGFARELLAVKDSLEAALAVGEGASVERLKEGVELTLKQLASVFEKHHITEVNPVGQRFDPNVHQAIATVPGTGEPNTVASVLQKGYLLHERVLRPALVTVCQGPAS
ncbi:MAG: nucleotide exchange factor GrpE [Thiobacillaceae bacterium]|nr:nucleotide exchange factor GrpE [Thiobacillaceae bacterium]MDW8324502.1 nucleotide exchange factor GrpE [Burkholderiales bacterium]